MKTLIELTNQFLGHKFDNETFEICTDWYKSYFEHYSSGFRVTWSKGVLPTVPQQIIDDCKVSMSDCPKRYANRSH